jgi:activating signal cointegrator 1
MKALTLTQPWATLVAIGAKRIETRSWSTSYRGPLAIHAAKGASKIGWPHINHICRHTEPFKSILNLDRHPAEALPLGAIVAVCELIDCWPIVDDGEYQTVVDDGVLSFYHWHKVDEPELSFGNYSPGRYAWLLADIHALPEPIPAKGALSLWEWERV